MDRPMNAFDAAPCSTALLLARERTGLLGTKPNATRRIASNVCAISHFRVLLAYTDADAVTCPLTLRDRLALESISGPVLRRIRSLPGFSLRLDHDVVVLNHWTREKRPSDVLHDPTASPWNITYHIEPFDTLLERMENRWYIPRNESTRVYLRVAEELRKEGPLVAFTIGNWVCMLTSVPKSSAPVVHPGLVVVLNDYVLYPILWLFWDQVISIFLKYLRYMAIPLICGILLLRELSRYISTQ